MMNGLEKQKGLDSVSFVTDLQSVIVLQTALQLDAILCCCCCWQLLSSSLVGMFVYTYLLSTLVYTRLYNYSFLTEKTVTLAIV